MPYEALRVDDACFRSCLLVFLDSDGHGGSSLLCGSPLWLRLFTKVALQTNSQIYCRCHSRLNISRAEVVEAARKLKRGKACGQDGLPPEFWKCICKVDSPACVWAVALCNKVRNHEDVPTDWRKELITIKGMQPAVRITGPSHCLLLGISYLLRSFCGV